MKGVGRVILVAEDMDLHFEALKALLERACLSLHVEHELIQTKSLAEVEKYLVACEQQGIPLLVIFDNLMDLPGGRFELEQAIRTLWDEEPETWRGNVPIVIYAETDKFDRLPRRRNSAVVHKVPESGENNLRKLRTAVRAGLQALMTPA